MFFVDLQQYGKVFGQRRTDHDLRQLQDGRFVIIAYSICAGRLYHLLAPIQIRLEKASSLVSDLFLLGQRSFFTKYYWTPPEICEHIV